MLVKQPFLNLSRLNRSATLFVIMLHVIDPSTHGIAPHEAGIIRHQQIGNTIYIN